MLNSSELRATANRLNALHSTGPITPEGKDHSRRNRLRHGLAAETVVTDDERAALAESLDALSELFTPDHIVEADLVRRTAVARVRLRRCEAARESRLDGDTRDALRNWDEKRRKRLRRQAQRLRTHPASTLNTLEQSAFGCDWLIHHWQGLDAPLAAGRPWTAEQTAQAFLLVGTSTDATETSSPLADRLRLLLNPGDDHTAPQGQADRASLAPLHQFIADRLDRLHALRDELWQTVDGPEREAVRLAALADAGQSRSARSAHRYEREAELSYHRNLKMIMKIRAENRRAAEAARKERQSGPRATSSSSLAGWYRDPVTAVPTPADSIPLSPSAPPRNEANPPNHPHEIPRLNPQPENDLHQKASPRSPLASSTPSAHPSAHPGAPSPRSVPSPTAESERPPSRSPVPTTTGRAQATALPESRPVMTHTSPITPGVHDPQMIEQSARKSGRLLDLDRAFLDGRLDRDDVRLNLPLDDGGRLGVGVDLRLCRLGDEIHRGDEGQHRQRDGDKGN